MDKYSFKKYILSKIQYQNFLFFFFIIYDLLIRNIMNHNHIKTNKNFQFFLIV